MAVLSVWHPEIEDFIDAKLTPNRLSKFNMSVGITPGFMEAVANNDKWNFVFPDTEHPKYTTEWQGDLDDWMSKGYDVITYKTVNAKDLWDKIMFATYTRNEPGVLFLDTVNKLNSLAYAEKIFASNPCSEITMSSGACLLGSMNVVKFIKIDYENRKVKFDYDAFRSALYPAIRYLDNINDISRIPLSIYKRSMQEKRRIGLGIMGLGSLHLMLGIRFGSKESLQLIENIYKVKAETEILASAKLGKEKGSFPLFDKEKYFNTYWWKNLNISSDVKNQVEEIGHMRNSHRSMNAPTGNTSIYCNQVSGGIEPVFSKEYYRWAIVPEYERTNLKSKGFIFPNVFKGEWFETDYMKYDKEGDEQVLKGEFEGTQYKIDKNRGLTKSTKVIDYGWAFAKEFYHDKFQEMEEQGIFDTTEKLKVKDHINTLAIAAHYTDMNNSKTTNVPEDYPYEDFKELYKEGYYRGIKGLTTYRANTMTNVLETEQTQKYQNDLEKAFKQAGTKVIPNVPKLPKEFYSKGYIIKDGDKKKWYILIAFVDSNHTRPYAIFVHTNNKETNEVTEDVIDKIEKLLIKKKVPQKLVEEQIEKYSGQKNTTKIARIIGMALRHNLQIKDIVETLDDCKIEMSSFLFHLNKLFTTFIQDGIKSKDKCPTCKSTLIYGEGCKKCLSCGWTAC